MRDKPKPEKLRTQDRARLAALLRERFPWLDTDREANGGDVVDELTRLYSDLKQGGER